MKKLKYNYDYTKTMMMKLGLAVPDRKGGSTVINTFADALEIIKKVDAITCEMPKIIYLVGWQYNGHDDKYPDFFEVNEALKCPDKTARESMLWLIEEAKKYHTTVSVHINFNDAYENAPSFDRFVKEKALIRDKKGRPHDIENYNGLKCYKTSFKEYWESGLFKEMFDRLLTVLPLEEAKTVHVDNFQCYKNYAPDISIKQMQNARRKMIEYVASKGIDITSEFVYREDEYLVNKPIFGLPREHNRYKPIDTLGIIPAVWWISQITRKDLLSNSPQEFCGGMFRQKRYEKYLYGNMQGEGIFAKYNDKSYDWESEFKEQFATVQVPFNYLCNFKRLSINGHFKNEHCVLENGVISYSKDRRITVNGNTVKENENLLLPLSHLKNTYIAYSKNGGKREWKLPNKSYREAKISVYENGEYKFFKVQSITNDNLSLQILPKQLLLIEFSK